MNDRFISQTCIARLYIPHLLDGGDSKVKMSGFLHLKSQLTGENKRFIAKQHSNHIAGGLYKAPRYESVEVFLTMFLGPK